MLEVRVLGELEVIRDGAPVTLPPSRKTRALLAYLALTRAKHRREELCEMFWDVPDDPRGALRWSLSKIRPLSTIRHIPGWLQTARASNCGPKRSTSTSLPRRPAPEQRLPPPTIWRARRPRSAGRCWPISTCRQTANSTLGCWVCARTRASCSRKFSAALTERLAATPQEALPYARELVRIDPYDETAWALLISNLARPAAARRFDNNTRPGCAPCAKSAAGRDRCSELGEQRRHQPPASQS